MDVVWREEHVRESRNFYNIVGVGGGFCAAAAAAAAVKAWVLGGVKSA
jgi:hypothetical protein